MKTSEELTEEIIQIAKWNGVFNGELETHTNQLLSEFESEIRKDQDKITRHACAESSLSCDDLESVHSAIINTKAIKEEQ